VAGAHGADVEKGKQDLARLIVVSNRVPVPTVKGSTAAAGGLAVALEAALKAHGGLWFGWSGKTSSEREIEWLEIRDFGNVTYAVADLNRRDVDEYYAGFANRALWPLCHYRLDLTDFSRKDMAGYFRVNRSFARLLAPLIRPTDLIWVHDYHLIPLASELRHIGVKNRIGYFHHIPWPPADVLSTLPVHDTIMRGLAAYDLVGLQTDYDVENFAGCMIREGFGKALGDNWYESYEHRFQVGAFPIGLDTAIFEKMAEEGSKNPIVKRTAQSLNDRDLVIGVDRLDYSKGIGQRIEAFSRFIEMSPSSKGKVTFLQITPKSRSEVPEYADMQKEIAELTGRVNGQFGDVDWVPIRYVNKTISRAALAGLYRIARAGIVTPLRDGMNLVAKEFVAAQDPENPGVLVLSRFAGAAREMDGALIVNPYDTEATANAIGRAISMPIEARRERYNSMMPNLRKHDVVAWCRDYLEALSRDGSQVSEQARSIAP
jgi:trehalose 6-phosphate synthase